MRVSGALSEDFTVSVGVHQGPVLSLLLFIIILNALSRDFGVGLPWELLYADDLVLIANSLRGAEEKFRKWREGIASKGLRVNINTTKVLHSGRNCGTVVKTGAYPYAVCDKGVESNSIQCSVCKCCVHHGKKRWTKIKVPLPKKIADIERFVCAMCKGDLVVSGQSVNLNFGNESLELVDKFCYLGDTISAGGWADNSQNSVRLW